jgi:hypothetical protein
LRLVQMAPDATHVALGQFIFRQNGEETGSRPAFVVRAGGDLGPELGTVTSGLEILLRTDHASWHSHLM